MSLRDGFEPSRATRVVQRSLVFVCDHDGGRLEKLISVLSADGRHVRPVTRLRALTDRPDGRDPALVVIGFSAADADETLAVVEQLRRRDRRLPIILVAASASEAIAVSALRAGVKDFLLGPLDCSALAASVGRWLSSMSERGGDFGASPAANVRLIGSSASMRKIEDYLARVAHHDTTVLITGETGTGKELVAARIHAMSRRRHARFVSVNCAAIPEGLLESELFGHESGAFTGAARTRQGLLQLADRGTVFFDEVGDMGLHGQAKLLRALETREVYRLGGTKPIPVDIRVVAATNQDLETAMDHGRFRKDLYFRLNVAHIHLPPLRERPADIVALLDHYVKELSTRFGYQVEGFSEEALETLKAYDWPGNVRELKNLLEAVFISAPQQSLQIEDLPERFRLRLRGIRNLPEEERRRLIDALVGANWNKSEAAKVLRWSRMTLYRKMAKYSVVKRTA